MVIKEFYKTRTDGVSLYRRYSDEGVYIQKVGTDEKYVSAVDVETATWEYIETTEQIVHYTPTIDAGGTQITETQILKLIKFIDSIEEVTE